MKKKEAVIYAAIWVLLKNSISEINETQYSAMSYHTTSSTCSCKTKCKTIIIDE